MIASEDFIRIIFNFSIDEHLSLIAPVPLRVVFHCEAALREIRGVSDLIEALLVLRHHVVVLYVGKGCPEIITYRD